MNPIKKTFRYGSHDVTFETGEIARQAHGSVVGDVGEVLETGHLLPGIGVEGLADTGDRAHGGKASRRGLWTTSR